MNNKTVAIISGATLIIGIGIGYFIFSPVKPAEHKPVIVNNISGAELMIKKEDYAGKNITLDVVYAGAGESEIVIPKSNIPEVFAWNNRVHSIELDYYMLYFGNKLFHAAGISYYHRWNRIEAGIGPIFGQNIYGFRAGIKYLF